MIDEKYNKILVANNGDNSDSANHTAYWYLMRKLAGEDVELPVYLYVDENGMFCRHPDRETNSFTRDQFVPFMAWAAIVNYFSTYAIEDYYFKVKKRGFFFNEVRSNLTPKPWWDRDLLDPQTRALAARMISSYNRPYKRWMHYIGDLNLYLTIRYKDAFKPDHNQDENIHCHLIVSKLVHPTFITKWCWDYYFFKTKKPWRQKIWDFFDRNGTYYPEIPPVAIAALEKLLND